MSYTFSTREKCMMALLVFILLALFWLRFVYLGTTDKITQLDDEIASVQIQNQAVSEQVSQLEQMKKTVSGYEASSSHKFTLPAYNNITALTARLNTVLSSAQDCSLSFEPCDTTQALIKRKANITFSDSSIKHARNILRKIRNNTYACSINSASIYDTQASGNLTSQYRVTVNAELVFYEINT